MTLFRPKLLIRADAGPATGTGHVMRCRALADTWANRGGIVHLVSGELPQSIREQLKVSNIVLHTCESATGSAADVDQVINIAGDIKADCILLDGYQFNFDYQSRIRHHGFTLMLVCDSENGASIDADFVLNQNVYARKTSYRSNTATILAGPEFALIRREFGVARETANTETKAQIQNVLVCFGGGDQPNLTRLAVESIQLAIANWGTSTPNVNVVLGHCNPHVAPVAEECNKLETEYRVYQSVDRMAELIAQADIAITSGGSICYELATLGVPALIIPIADNQRPVVKALHHLGVAEAIEASDALTADFLGRRFSELAGDKSRRELMSSSGRNLVDGKGADRVVREVIKSLIRLRPATFDDAEQLWKWRNESAVRKASFSSDNVCFDTHAQWLVSRLVSENCRLMIASFETGVPFGQVRFDFDETRDATISVSIDERYRGRGLASSLISRSTEIFVNQFTDLPRIRSVVANIKTSNFASRRSFEAAGYAYESKLILDGSDAVRYVFEVGTDQAITTRTSLAG